MKHQSTFKGNIIIQYAINKTAFKNLFTVLILILMVNISSASNFYWVGGTGNWSDYGAHWATTSGGVIFQTTVPAPSDDVFFDGNSFATNGQNVTIDLAFATCKDMNWTGVQYNPEIVALSFNSLDIYGSLTLAAGVKFTLIAGINFESTTPGKTITSNGDTINCNIWFNGIGGSWSLTDNFVSTGTFRLNKGSFNTNNHALDCFDFNFSSPDSLNLGSSVINCSGFFTGVTGVISSASSTINVTGDFFSPGMHTYNNVNIGGEIMASYSVFNDVTCRSINGSSNVFNHVIFNSQGLKQSVNGSQTFHTATFVGSDVEISSNCIFDSLVFLNPGQFVQFYNGTTQTINNSLIANGTCNSWISFRSRFDGMPYTITKTSGNVTVDYLLIKDCQATGGATFIATNSISLGNISGWNINSPVPINLYWVGNSGNWNDPTHWSTTSGGSGGTCIPNPTDNVFFDANSFSISSQVVVINSDKVFCNDMNWNGVQYNPELSSTMLNSLDIYGSLTLAAGVKFTLIAGINFESTTPGKTITSNGDSINCNIWFNGIGGSWSFTDNFTTTGSFHINKGSFNTNNHALDCFDFNFSSPDSLNLGSSVINCSGFFTGVTGVISSASSTINVTGDFFSPGMHTYNNVNIGGEIMASYSVFNDVTCRSINGSSNVFNHVIFNSQGMKQSVNGSQTFHTATFVGSDVEISSNCIFDSLVFLNPGQFVQFYNGTTQTINNSLIANGTCNSWISFRSRFDGMPYTITKTSGNVTVDYLLIKDCQATGGATFIATNSISLGNISGWNINSPVPINLYWVGNSGNWNDPTHWSTTSGGSGGTCIPNPTDNVFFDANSFSISSQVVVINSDKVFCNDMNWNGVQYNPELSSTMLNSLDIYGSLTLAAGVKFTLIAGINFESTTPGKTITSNGDSINCNIWFNGIGGSWSFTDNFTTTGSFHINKGSFNTNNHALDCFDFNFSSPDSLNLGSSVINCSGFFTGVTGVISSASSTINVTGDFFSPGMHTYNNVNIGGEIMASYSVFNDVTCRSINGSSNVFNHVIFNSQGMKQSVNGSQTFHTATFVGSDVEISSNCIFDSLVFLNPGNQIKIQSNSQITVNDYLRTSPLPGFPTQIQSTTQGTQATISSTSANPICLEYVYLQDIIATGGATFYAGNYSVDLGNNTGWIWSGCTPDTSNVWPGDANYDLVADNNDVLYIGLAYGYTGPTRAGATNNWVAQPGVDWLQQFANGSNIKHADCDGNGTINAIDTLAVTLNYGQTHPFKLAAQNSQTNTGVPLYFDLPTGALVPGSVVSIPIMFGNSLQTVNNLYGIAFTINYDPAYIQAGTMQIDFSNSWMGNNLNTLHLTKDFNSVGAIDMGYVKTDHLNTSGNGQFATLTFTVANGAAGLTNLSFSKIFAIDKNEFPISVTPISGSVYASIIENPSIENLVTVYPNPASTLIVINDLNSIVTHIKLIDRIGKEIYSEKIKSNKTELNIASIAEGLYILQVETSKGLLNKKVIIKR